MSTPTGTPTSATTPAPTTTPESTESAATSTPAGTPTWTEPRPPSTPEAKYDETNRTRIFDVRLVNREPSSGGDGYTAFDIEVDANTSMENVDPPEHGTVAGEPYFVAFANDQIIYRSEQVEFRNGTFTLDVHPGALDQFDEGSLKVTVFLMDRDSIYHDEYDYGSARIMYIPESGSANATETASG